VVAPSKIVGEGSVVPTGLRLGLGTLSQGSPFAMLRVHPGLFSASPSGGGFLHSAPERIFIPFAGPKGPWKLRMTAASML
jgi:hypothetical protein